MRFCLYFILWAALFTGGTLSAADTRHVATQQPRVRSVVRADTRTGRLVRTVVVAPKLVRVNAIAPVSTSLPAPGEASVPELVEATAKRYGVDPLLVHSVIQVESGYNPYAISHKGAQGLMQLIPATARRFGVRNVFDAQENIEGGVRYLKYLDSLFPHDLRLALAAYNAGEGAVWKYNNRVPPYRETEQYVYKVGSRYGKALRDAEKKKSTQPLAESTPPPAPQPSVSYAKVESFMDADGRLHLRTAALEESGSTRTP